MLTRSASERRDIACKSKLGEQHKKQLRYFLLCLVMFCVDDRCSLPMHMLLADLIDSQGQGGTAFLIHALNKLGICSSLDTLQRHIQSKIDPTKRHPCSGFFNSSTFTVVSVDNIDFLHSFAGVFKGGSNSSWHGTTVQLVQPLPGIEPVQLSQGPVQLSQGSAELGQGPAQFGQGPVQLGQQSAQLDQGSVQLDQGSVQLGQQSAQLG